MKKTQKHFIKLFLFLLVLTGVQLAPTEVEAGKSVTWSANSLPQLLYYATGDHAQTGGIPLTTSTVDPTPENGCWLYTGLESGGSVSVNFSARIINVDTGLEIPDGANVVVGTRIKAERITSTESTDISWNGTGRSQDTPLGRWVSLAGPVSNACEMPDRVGTNSIISNNYNSYVLLNMNYPNVNLVNPSLNLSPLGGGVYRVTATGPVSLGVEFSNVFGRFYYRYYGNGMYGIGCHGNNVPLSDQKEMTTFSIVCNPGIYKGPYTLNVPPQTITFNLTASAPATNNASCVGYSLSSSDIIAGSSFTGTVTMNNSGDTTWSSASQYRLDNANTLWGKSNVNLPAGSIAPGSSVTFSDTFTAPTTPSTYNFSWQMEQNGTPFGSTCTWSIPVRAAQCTGLPANATYNAGEQTGFTGSDLSAVYNTGDNPGVKCEYSCDAGYSYSAGTCTSTPPPPAPPTTPTGLNATAGTCGSGSITVNWNNVSNATSYTLRDSSTVIYSGAGTSYNHTGLTDGSSHSYTVLATNADGSSAYSGTVNATAPSACLPPPNQPPGLPVIDSTTVTTAEQLRFKGTDPEGDQIRFAVDWNDPANGIDGYTSYVASDNTTWAPISHPFTSAGTYAITVYAEDDNGALGSSRVFLIDVSLAPPPPCGGTLSYTIIANSVDYSSINPAGYPSAQSDCTDTPVSGGSCTVEGETCEKEWKYGTRQLRCECDSGATPPAQCDDGIDNDGDGLYDLEDPHCATSTDGDESGPNLTSQNLIHTSGILQEGETLNFTASVLNNGTAGTPTSFSDVFEYRYGATGGFTTFKTEANSALAMNGSDPDSASYTIPAGASTWGDLYIQHCIDSTGQITESDESVADNCEQMNLGIINPLPPQNPPTSVSASTGVCDSNTISITWSAVTGATSYSVLDNGTPIASVTGTSYNHSVGNVGTTEHRYTIRATNISGSSLPSSPDTTAFEPWDCLTANGVEIDALEPSMNISSASEDGVDGTYDNVRALVGMQNLGLGTVPAGTPLTYKATIDIDNYFTDPDQTSSVGSYTGGLNPTGTAGDQSATLTRTFDDIPFGTHTVCALVNLDAPIYTEYPNNTANNTHCASVTIAVPQPPLSITSSKNLIRAGETATISWSAHTAYTMNCTVSGAGGLNTSFDASANHPTGPVTGSQTTTAISNTSEFTLSCIEPHTNTTFEETVLVEVAPDYEER